MKPVQKLKLVLINYLSYVKSIKNVLKIKSNVYKELVDVNKDKLNAQMVHVLHHMDNVN
jgi:hypothetical protein